MKAACTRHDQANLLLLPVLGALTVAGLAGWVSPYHVTVFFTAYILADFTWIAVQPEAVPSLPHIILVHHAVTLLLLAFPLRYPEELAIFTCWDGLCEINTFFLIARRQWKSLRRPLSAIYWATFFPLRIALYPLMLVQFWQQMRRGGHAWWEVGAVCGSQAALIAFNVMLLALSAGNWRKRRGGRGRRGPAAPAAPGSPAGGKAAKDFSPTATINAEAATRM